MATFTLKLDTRNKAAKVFLEFVKTLSFVQIEEQKEETYNPEFVKKVLKARAEQGGIEVTSENLWDRIK